MKTLQHESGFSLVTAIFLLVVLASVGAFMITIGGSQRTTSVAAIQGARAYQAARSGLEWGVWRVLNANMPEDCTTITANPAFSFTVDGLNQFNVNVTCSVTDHTESGDTVQVYVITSVATFGTYGAQEYVRRQVTATVSPPP